MLLIRLAPNSYRPIAALGGPTLGSCCCRSSCGSSTLVSSRLQAAPQMCDDKQGVGVLGASTCCVSSWRHTIRELQGETRMQER